MDRRPEAEASRGAVRIERREAAGMEERQEAARTRREAAGIQRPQEAADSRAEEADNPAHQEAVGRSQAPEPAD
jgi:hypothetical protein